MNRFRTNFKVLVIWALIPFVTLYCSCSHTKYIRVNTLPPETEISGPFRITETSGEIIYAQSVLFADSSLTVMSLQTDPDMPGDGSDRNVPFEIDYQKIKAIEEGKNYGAKQHAIFGLIMVTFIFVLLISEAGNIINPSGLD